jgi:hypothetical protein
MSMIALVIWMFALDGVGSPEAGVMHQQNQGEIPLKNNKLNGREAGGLAWRTVGSWQPRLASASVTSRVSPMTFDGVLSTLRRRLLLASRNP